MTSRKLRTENVFPLSRKNIESKKDIKKERKTGKKREREKEKDNVEKKMSECRAAALQGDVRRSRGSNS